jgi:hypothetical protein
MPRFVWSSLLAGALLAVSVPLVAAEQVVLSTLDLGQARQGWGAPGIDRSVAGKPLRIAGTSFARGFGTHAPSELDLALAGGSERFTASVGIDDEEGATGGNGSVEFIIHGDGSVRWRSGIMHGGDAAKRVDLDVSGIATLVLEVSDGGDGNGGDHADWADATLLVSGTRPAALPIPQRPRWALGDGQTTVWAVDRDQDPGHEDFLEQGGRGAGQVVSYRIGADRSLSLTHTVIWPSLRIIPNNTHGSLIHAYGPEAEPAVTIDGMPLGPLTVATAILDGTLTFRGQATHGIAVERCTFPATEARAAIDRWTLRNTAAAPVTVAVAPLALEARVRGPYGMNVMAAAHAAPATTVLAPGDGMSFAVTFQAHLDGEAALALDATAEEAGRRAFVASLQRELRLETPDAVLDRAFSMAKIRVAESINKTRGGLMLAPGGLSYYAATWCNDNVEYAGPFFPFLGDQGGNQASLDTYRGYVPFMTADYHAIPSSIVAEGTSFWNGAGDRGDAAMYAYGCPRFCLARGDRLIAEELWPAISWCLEYCRRQTRPDGAISSTSDELEGRFPTGKANLSTACLYYGGLRAAADLGRALGRGDEAGRYDDQATLLAGAIERYFGATVEGFATYRYYDGNDVLRSWICLPLCMGLMERRDATISALFSPRMWSADGLATQAGNRTFWDRSTLYGLRGVFQAGATERALGFLSGYSRRRLLGEHVPYAVETGAQGSQLASESGLYCRIFTEGLFGILPTGFDRFRCTPRLPEGWPRMALRSLRACGRDWDLVVERQGPQLRISAGTVGGRTVVTTIAPGGSADIVLP